MKVIDMLQKIANGEKVRFKIIDEDITYHLDSDGYIYDESMEENTKWYLDKSWLNKEVEIIEEDKKIEKLEEYSLDKEGKYPINVTIYESILKDKINEIIDKLNEVIK